MAAAAGAGPRRRKKMGGRRQWREEAWDCVARQEQQDTRSLSVVEPLEDNSPDNGGDDSRTELAAVEDTRSNRSGRMRPDRRSDLVDTLVEIVGVAAAAADSIPSHYPFCSRKDRRLALFEV